MTTDQWIDLLKLGVGAAGAAASASAAGKRADVAQQSATGANLADIIRGGILDQFNYSGRVDPNFNPLGENYYGPLRAGFSADVIAGKAGSKLTSDEINRATSKHEVPQIGYNYGDFLGQYTTTPYRTDAIRTALANQLQRTGGLQEVPDLGAMYGEAGVGATEPLRNLQQAILGDRASKQQRAESILAQLMDQQNKDKQGGGFWNSWFGKLLKGAIGVGTPMAANSLTNAIRGQDQTTTSQGSGLKSSNATAVDDIVREAYDEWLIDQMNSQLPQDQQRLQNYQFSLDPDVIISEGYN